MYYKKVIEIDQLTKVYSLYAKPLDRLTEFFIKGKKHTDFVALDSVNLSVNESETFGIIGENGAGKSTLLQLIAGTLSPTSGTIRVTGTVLALLELGIGFHPDFTGRDNVFLYGDMLGLPRSFIQSKLNEIIEFSELEAFMDWPLKTYSTGMQMRLAFSLVSSLEPDILIIDEALSVGDMHFQKKCIDRIMDFRQRGKTIIFCSHSTYQVSILCDKVIWLKDGKIEMYGKPETVIPAYEFYQLEKGRVQYESSEDIAVSHERPVLIKEFEILNSRPLKKGDDLKFRLQVLCVNDNIPYNITLSIKIESGWAVFATGTHLSGKEHLQGREREIIITYPNVPLMGGMYYAIARVFDDKGLMVYHERGLQPFEVEKDSLELGTCHLENIWKIN